MKKFIQQFSLAFGLLFFAFQLNGCYTQIGSSKSEPYSDYESGEEDEVQYDQGVTQYPNYGGGQYGDYWSPRNQFFFEYYYAPFSYDYYPYVTYSWNRWNHWGYSYYNPFWCGTSYPPIYAGAGFGWPYGHPWGYSPWGYGGYGHGGYTYGGSGGDKGTPRTFGNTRGGGESGSSGDMFRDNRGRIEPLPTGMRSGSSGGGSSYTPGTSRTRGGDSGTRAGSTGRGGTTRGGSREGTPRVNPNSGSSDTNTPPSGTVNTGRRDDSRGGGRTAPPPPSYTPPPSNGGSRGGGERTSSPPPQNPPREQSSDQGESRSGGNSRRGGER